MKNKCTVTPNLVTTELPQILVEDFNCFKSYVLFGCIERENNNNNSYGLYFMPFMAVKKIFFQKT